MGEAYSGLEDTDNAIKYFGLAVEHEDKSDRKNMSILLTRLAELKFTKGEQEETKNLWERALELDPKNSQAVNVLEISKNATVDIDNMKSTLNLFSEFSTLKESDFFNINKIKAFRSEEEKIRFEKIIDTVFRSEVQPNIDILKELSKENRMEWFKRIEIDFINDAAETESEEQLKFEKEVNERFPFLLEDGIRIAYIARPALAFAGMSEVKLTNFM